MSDHKQNYIHSLFDPQNVLVLGQISNADLFVESRQRDHQLLAHPARLFHPNGTSLFQDVFYPLWNLFNRAANDNGAQLDLFPPVQPQSFEVHTLDCGPQDCASLSICFSENSLWGFQSAANLEAAFYEQSKSAVTWIDPQSFGFDQNAQDAFKASFQKLIREFRYQ